MYYVSESVDLNHSSLNLVRHTTFNLASCLISSCYWLWLHQKLYKKHVLYVNCVWIIKGCIKDQSPLSFTHIGECFNELREILYSCNHCQFLILAVMHRWENTGRCTVYISCIWWILQWTTRYSLLMQPQPDWRTLFLLTVVCHNEIKIHVHKVLPYKFVHVLNQMNICTIL